MGARAATRGTDARGASYRGLVAAPTNNDLRKVCFEGESGLMAVIPSSLVQSYNKTDSIIRLHNGAYIGGIGAETSARFRGPQWHDAWCDELAAWADSGRDPQEAWDIMSMSVRLGEDTRILATTTPKPTAFIRGLINDPTTVVTRASTHVNRANLSKAFIAQLDKYEGTKIGRQEIYAEVIDSEEGGIISREWLNRWPADKRLPQFEYIVLSLDTAFSEESYDKKKQSTDPSACSVWGGFIHKTKPNIMLLDCWEERLGFPDLVDKVKVEAKNRYGLTDNRFVIKPQHPPPGYKVPKTDGKAIDVILIEEKASGKSLIQQLAADGILCQGFNPGKANKLTRLHVASPLAAHGKIWIPESPKRPGQFISWAEPLVNQLCSFSGEGSVLHDDLLDTTTQAWRLLEWQWMRYVDIKNKERKEKIALGGDPDAPKKPPERINPYG